MTSKHILLTGGTGFLGRTLCNEFLKEQHNLIVWTRNKAKAQKYLPAKVRLIENLAEINDQEQIDIVINLAGAPIDKRWTAAYCKVIYQSRVELTHQLIIFLSRLAKKPAVLISGSAVGYYGNHSSTTFTEASPFENSFCHELCHQWEQAAEQAFALGIRVCCIRSGIVLGSEGGIIKRLKLPFQLGLGGKIANGNQWMSWIHLKDWVRIVCYCIENTAMSGPVNATAPVPVTNQHFTKAFAAFLKRPAFFSIPGIILRVILGKMADELLINGQRVIPQKLIETGFIFEYATIEQALQHLDNSDN